MINPKARPCDQATIQATRATGICPGSSKPWVLVAAILASSISFVDESVLNVALPAIETGLATSAAVVQWIVNADTLFLSAFLLVGGTAGDLFGRRRIFVIGVAIFAAASAWCGLSVNVNQLILGRAIQGIGGALLIPSSLAIIGATFDESERGKAIGTWAGVSTIAAAVGPLFGGWIVDHFTWRWIFLINPVLALPTIAIALYHVPESRDAESKGGLDWRGSILIFLALAGLAFGLISAPIRGWSDARVFPALLIGLLLLAAFIWVEASSRNPMLPLGLFRSRTFSAVNLLTLLLYAALAGAFFFLPFALIQVGGFSAGRAGAAFLPLTLIMALLSRWSGGLLDRFGARWPLVIGPVIAALGFGLLAWPINGGPYWEFLVPIGIIGLGMAVSAAPLTTVVISAVPAHQTGIAAGVNNAVASVASLFGIALLGAVAVGIYNRALDDGAATTVSGPVQQAIQIARGQFVTGPALSVVQGQDRQAAEIVIKGVLGNSIQIIMLICAALALAGGASGLLLPTSPNNRTDLKR
jgi:EmrB/QacA subfamily drug resistance transporter